MPDAFPATRATRKEGEPMAKTPAPSTWASTVVGSALEVAKGSRNLPVGALLGLSAGIALTGALHYAFTPTIPMWLLGLAVPFCTLSGVGIQKLLHWKFGWKLDTELHHAKLKHDTDLKLAELRERVAAGVLTAEQGQRIGAQIAREGLLGPARPRGPRPPRRRKDRSDPPLSATDPLKPAA
jgi:hypothetical protein